jgi:hypothetical protein
MRRSLAALTLYKAQRHILYAPVGRLGLGLSLSQPVRNRCCLATQCRCDRPLELRVPDRAPRDTGDCWVRAIWVPFRPIAAYGTAGRLECCIYFARICFSNICRRTTAP